MMRPWEIAGTREISDAEREALDRMEPFRCVCPLDPTDTVNGFPRAVEGCPAHRGRFAAQNLALPEIRKEQGQ